MTLDYSTHKNILLRLLKDIYTDTSIAPHLGFKGGTAAMLFYGLNRYSVDLDFDLLNEEKEREVFDKISKIAAEYGSVKESRIKRHNIITVLSYDEKAQNIKIEVNRRVFGSRYDFKTLLGISMLVMNKEDMFANKLMAMIERLGKTSRYVFDVYFFAKNMWPINKELVERRSGVSYPDAVKKAIELLDKLDNRKILDGLGEFLIPSQKDWARSKLRTETIFLLKVMLETESGNA